MVRALGEAMDAGWRLFLTCQRRREALKSVRPCKLEQEIDVASLVASLGHLTPLAGLEDRICCPRCASRHVGLRWIGEEPKRKAEPIMQPVGPGWTLGTYEGPVVIVACELCKRRGVYRTKSLLKKFSPDTFMTELHARIAESGGCQLAREDLLNRSVTEAAKCRAKFEISPASRPQVRG